MGNLSSSHVRSLYANDPVNFILLFLIIILERERVMKICVECRNEAFKGL